MVIDRKNRTLPISKELYESLPDDKKGRLFSDCYGAFRSALEITGIELPAGQLTHVLRHNFASHFMMNGGNILALQRVPGHTDIKMTMRYAHFATEHLEDAVKLNTLANK
ncbi:tyrosine-type recombinase/integrase [Bacillus amyloliquefaciens]|nr:tyrosine-type recombinase/integrase [Bacillus amyloliquefaciens]